MVRKKPESVWLLTKMIGFKAFWKCVKCEGVVIQEPNEPHFKYCPHCGRRMSSYNTRG